MKLLKSCLVLILLCSSVYAKDSAHIISGQSSSTLDSEKSTFDERYETDFTFGLGYDYAFQSGFQMGGTLGAAIYSGGSLITASLGPGYNFSSEDVENSFFVALRFGFRNYHIDSSMSATDTFLTAEIAKRFKILENVSYVPGVTALKYLGTDAADPSFSLQIFRLSLVF